MNIYLYSITFKSPVRNGGGGSKSTDTTIKYLRKYGHQVFFFYSIKKLKKKIIEKKPDIVLHHNIHNMYKVYKICKKYNIPIIVTLNDEITCINSFHIHFKKNRFGTPYLKHTFLKALSNNFFNKQKYFKDRIKDTFTVPIRCIIRYNRLKTLKGIDGLIVIGKTGIKLLNIAGVNRKIYVSPQPIDDSFLIKEKEIKQKFNQKEKLIFISKSEIQDAPDAVIEAFLKSKVNGKIICPNIKRHPKHREITKKFSKYKNVIFVDKIPFEKIKDFYSTLYLTVFSTVEIGTFGRSWAESLCRGIPVLSYHGRGHIEDYLKHKENAYLVDCKINSLVKGFKELFNDEKLWYKLRINGWKYGKKKLIASKVVPNLIKIYNEILTK